MAGGIGNSPGLLDQRRGIDPPRRQDEMRSSQQIQPYQNSGLARFGSQQFTPYRPTPYQPAVYMPQQLGARGPVTLPTTWGGAFRGSGEPIPEGSPLNPTLGDGGGK